jgi:hypothetical protein
LQSEEQSEKPLPSLGTATVNRPSAVSFVHTLAACAAALVLPGLGHLALGRWARGVAVGLGITAMFGLGLWMQGRVFTPQPGDWLTWLFSFLDAGLGLPYFACVALGIGTKIQAAAQTYEYGTNFIAVAGALNMLAVMDVYDIAIGRKA